jgi:phosphonate transport system substrate-binding protein
MIMAECRIMRYAKKFPSLVVWFIVLAAVFFCPRAAAPVRAGASAPARYTLGIIPQFEQRKLHAIWKPIVEELERRTGFRFELQTTLKIQDFEKEFFKGGFDFVFINPYHLFMTTESHRYIPLVSDTRPLRGILVVRKDSPVTKPEDLEGKVVAFPSPNAVGASLMIRADLERLRHVKVKPIYVKTHSSVYLHVATGLAAAGGGVERTLQEQAPEIRDSLRVIYTTRGMQSHPVAAHPRVAKENREKVRRALLAMDATPEGRALLSRVPIRKVVAVSLDDYLAMRGWGLDDYVDSSWSED